MCIMGQLQRRSFHQFVGRSALTLASGKRRTGRPIEGGGKRTGTGDAAINLTWDD